MSVGVRSAPGAARNGLSRVNRADRRREAAEAPSAPRRSLGRRPVSSQQTNVMAHERRKKVRGQTRKQRLAAAIWASEHVRAHVRRLFTRGTRKPPPQHFRVSKEGGRHTCCHASVCIRFLLDQSKSVPRPFIAARDNKGHSEDRRRAAWIRQTSRSIDSCVKKGPAVWPGVLQGREGRGGTTCRVQDGIPETAPGCCHANAR